MRVLITGSGGLLGGNVVSTAIERGWEVVGTYHSAAPEFDCPLYQLDVRSRSDCKAVFENVRPDAVINCAAVTDVDGCETNPEQANAVNVEGARTLAQLAHDWDIQFLHTSTDYVFDGNRESPYPEEAPTNPLQTYGESKLAGEKAVRDVYRSAVIARLSFVYGRTQPAGELSGFPAWVRETAATGESVPLFTDQYITPSQAETTAQTLLELLNIGAQGTYNVACRSYVTPYEFGETLLEELGRSADLLEPSSLEAINREASRPAYTCLDTAKVESLLGRPQPTLTEDITALF
ncbi:dTDP-4-dehydrorhamnose reductase [Haloarchaeobius amylolyticus]|uniref:dTDP-4-dehydrorhamnose reductase n=1 Tax=Haloarchaeobius amylolyticus TaxID=1198296 RepID=A0ABD6BDZ7_9EURY